LNFRCGRRGEERGRGRRKCERHEIGDESDSLIERAAVGIGDGDSEGGKTVDTTMSPFATTVAGTVEVRPNASFGQTVDGSGGIRRTSAGTKGQEMGRRR